ncbi:MAG: peptidoglycan DD-metalloendopeptidase family protein [Woeseiaceae bacterium]|nr:peptidoglycan DD-metalloendopeptidase family protein [Woeseiaceae bacterium]
MNRPVSPLLHDYKPTSEKKSSKGLQWFVAGLGIPLLGLLVITLQAPDPEDEPVVIASTPAETPVAGPVADEPDYTPVFTERPSILLDDVEPEPEFDSLTLKIGRGDTLDKLFRRHDLDLGHLAQIARLNEAGKYFRNLRPGDEFEILHEDGNLVSMYSVLDLTSALKVERQEGGFSEEIVERPIEKRTTMEHAMIESSLYMSGNEAGLSDKVIMNLAGIFGWDIDFVYDIRAGDSFYVKYEEIWQDGEFVMDGEIVAAEFNNQNETFRAIRFVDREGRTDYFTPEGRSVRKAFLRAPVDARVSSRFNPKRRHPVLNTIRPHRGVDYGAPTGTPIKAAGDGKVIFRGGQRGYGNVVILQHGGNITTLYAHMSRFQRGVGVGTKVRQGQIIGYVGATGMVTGPHLHYEYRVNGVHQNPRTVRLPQADPIDSRDKARFIATSEPILQSLDEFKRSRLATVALSNE